jgi:hypothetical protein
VISQFSYELNLLLEWTNVMARKMVAQLFVAQMECVAKNVATQYI